MKRDLKSMANGKTADLDIEKLATSVEPAVAQNITEAVETYSKKSRDELMSELKRMTSEQLNSGQMTREDMQRVVGNLSQMLTPEQLANMRQVLSGLS